MKARERIIDNCLIYLLPIRLILETREPKKRIY
jgi:hypothetical protein